MRSIGDSLSFSDLPVNVRTGASARRAKPILHGQHRGHVPAAPVRALADRHSVHTLVNAANTLAPENVGEHGPRRRRLHTRLHLLVTRDLGRLHTGTEAHRRVRLHDTTNHTARKTRGTRAAAKRLRHLVHLARREQQHTAFRRRLDPRLPSATRRTQGIRPW